MSREEKEHELRGSTHGGLQEAIRKATSLVGDCSDMVMKLQTGINQDPKIRG